MLEILTGRRFDAEKIRVRGLNIWGDYLTLKTHETRPDLHIQNISFQNSILKNSNLSCETYTTISKALKSLKRS